MSNKDDDDSSSVDSDSSSSISSLLEQELEFLQLQLTTIEALEERNEAQLDSFIDRQHQWEEMEKEERELLERKPELLQRMETLTEELIQFWMGAKSQEG
jgi:hypothetical protein